MNPKIAIIGSSSMIASQALGQFEQKKIETTAGDLRGDNPIDITQKDSTESFFEKNDFDWAILFAAYTDVDGAEKQRNDKEGICWKINVLGTENVATCSQKFKRKLIFLSTDFVFDGTRGPYSEGDQTGPDLDKVGWYGISKIEGEKNIQNSLSQKDYIILRLSYPYSGKNVGKEDFVIKTVKLYKEGKLYPMYADQTFTPTYIPDVADAILKLLEKEQSGIFNLASPEPCTPYDFAKYLLAKYTGQDADVEKGSLKKQMQQGATPRPQKGGLKTEKIAQFFNPTSYKDGIEKAVKNLTLD